MSPKLAGKATVVVGGTSGIGRGIARLFASEGASVMVAGRRVSMGEETLAELAAEGTPVSFVRADVTRESEARGLICEAVDQFGAIDILVNAVGHGTYGTVLETDRNQWDAVLDVNLTAVYECSRHALDLWMRKHGGTILNIASGSGTNGIRGMAAYGAAKAGVVNLTRCLAVDSARFGVRVNCISPGFVHTPALEASVDGPSELETLVTRLSRRYPLGRIGQPGDVARAALFLTSEDSSFITGVNLPVDGGYSCYA